MFTRLGKYKVTVIRSGKGTIRPVVTVPKEYYVEAGVREFIAYRVYDVLMYVPVKEVVVKPMNEPDVNFFRGGVGEACRKLCTNAVPGALG